jgi:hypothetical protein
MFEQSWSRAYFAVVVVACLVVPITTLVAADSAAWIPGLMMGDGQLSPITKLFVRFSVPVYFAIGGTALFLIGILAINRKRAISTVLSVGLFVVCVSFDVLALWALQMPLISKVHSFVQ